MKKSFRRPVLACVVVHAVLCCTGCVEGPCRTGQSPAGPQESIKCDTFYVGHGSPFDTGGLAVRTARVTRCEGGAPFDMLVHAPEEPGSYAVVVFQHGFMAHNSAYSEILVHLAGHGFVVVAPQMYEPGIGPLFGRPTAAEEAEWAATVLDWLPGNLDSITGVHACTDRLGLAGHSRGGKVAWLVLCADSSRAKAVAGVDPVDGTGGPLGGQDRVVRGPFGFPFPSLVIGTGLGGACAPAGDNHVQFYEASAPPAWHVVAPNAGHADMLDPDALNLVATTGVCTIGADPAGMRRLTGGLLAAFFRGCLQGDSGALAYLTDTSLMPIETVVEAKPAG